MDSWDGIPDSGNHQTNNSPNQFSGPAVEASYKHIYEILQLFVFRENSKFVCNRRSDAKNVSLFILECYEISASLWIMDVSLFAFRVHCLAVEIFRLNPAAVSCG